MGLVNFEGFFKVEGSVAMQPSQPSMSARVPPNGGSA